MSWTEVVQEDGAPVAYVVTGYVTPASYVRAGWGQVEAADDVWTEE
jgi:hypothetical protein